MPKKLPLLCAAALALAAPAAAGCPILETDVRAVSPHGSFVLALTPQQLKNAGYDYDDLIRVEAGGVARVIPYGRSASGVLPGRPLLLESQGTLELAVNSGSFATDGGLPALRKTTPVRLSLAEKGGSAEQRRKLRLRATDERGDYESDAVFANFREVRGGRLGRRALYRSSIPSSVERPRAPYADALTRQAGVRTVLNLANSPERLQKNMESPVCRSPYYRSLWRGGGVIARALPAAFGLRPFRDGLAEELRFMARRSGPYLVHCAEGKDRAGFVCFLLGSLMGASPDELKDDYGQSFVNYYHLKRGEPRYDLHVNAGAAFFERALGRKAEEPPRAAAERYLRGIGLTAAEIGTLKRRLAAQY